MVQVNSDDRYFENVLSNQILSHGSQYRHTKPNKTLDTKLGAETKHRKVKNMVA